MTESEFSQNNAKNPQDDVFFSIESDKKPKLTANKEMPFFFIDDESIKKLEEGQADIELILDARYDHLISDNTLSSHQQDTLKDRLGSYKESSNGKLALKFPEKYLALITRRQKEGKLKRIVLIKQDGKHVIDVASKQDIPPLHLKTKIKSSQENEKYRQVLCVITDYFPTVKKNEQAFLAYVDENLVELSDVMKDKKVIQLNHFIPWNINEKVLKNILKSQRLAVIVRSSERSRLYLTKECEKKLRQYGGVVFAYPYYIPKEKLQKAFPEEKNLSGERAILSITINHVQSFDQEQYACACKLSSFVLACQQQLGGNDRILLGQLLMPSDKRMPIQHAGTLSGIIAPSGERTSSGSLSYFYLSENGLNRLGIDSKIIQIKAIHKDNIKTIDHWNKIVNECRLVAIMETGHAKIILIHHKILDDRPLWIQDLLPIAIEENGNFLIYHPDIVGEFIDQKNYDQLVIGINSFVEKMIR